MYLYYICMPVHQPLGLYLSDFSKFCPRLSVELDPSSLVQGQTDFINGGGGGRCYWQVANCNNRTIGSVMPHAYLESPSGLALLAIW